MKTLFVSPSVYHKALSFSQAFDQYFVPSVVLQGMLIIYYSRLLQRRDLGYLRPCVRHHGRISSDPVSTAGHRLFIYAQAAGFQTFAQ